MTESLQDDQWNEVHTAVWLIPAVMLLLALFPLPYGYYTLLRLIVCGAVAYLAYREFDVAQRSSGWFFILGVIAVLFNPLIPIHLSREIWAPIDVVVAIILIIHWFRTKKKRMAPKN